MTTPDNFAAEPEHYLPQEVDEFNTICKHILRNELAAARKILDRRMRDGVAEQSNAADMIAEERDAWEKRAKTEATLRLQCANDSQMHLDRALAAEAENAALRVWIAENLMWQTEAYSTDGNDTGYFRTKLLKKRVYPNAMVAIDAAMREGKG